MLLHLYSDLGRGGVPAKAGGGGAGFWGLLPLLLGLRFKVNLLPSVEGPTFFLVFFFPY